MLNELNIGISLPYSLAVVPLIFSFKEQNIALPFVRLPNRDVGLYNFEYKILTRIINIIPHPAAEIKKYMGSKGEYHNLNKR